MCFSLLLSQNHSRTVNYWCEVTCVSPGIAFFNQWSLLNFLGNLLGSEIQTKLVVSNFRVKLDSILKTLRGKRRHMIMSFSMLGSSFFWFFWFGSTLLTSHRDQVSDLASVELEHIPNVEHMLKSTVEFKPYRPGGISTKISGKCFSFPSDAPFLQHTKLRIQHFELLLEASWSFPAGRDAWSFKDGERVCVCVSVCVCFADVEALIQQSPSAVSDGG